MCYERRRKVFYLNLSSFPRFLIAEVGEWRRGRGRIQFCSDLWRFNFALLAFTRRHSKRFHIINNLPPLPFGQRCPRRHAIIYVAFGDIPKQLARGYRFEFFDCERRDIARSLPVLAVTARTAKMKKTLGGGRWLAFVRIL